MSPEDLAAFRREFSAVVECGVYLDHGGVEPARRSEGRQAVGLLAEHRMGDDQVLDSSQLAQGRIVRADLLPIR